MTEREYAQKMRKLGRNIFEANGTYWEIKPRLFCRPAFFYKAIVPGESKPPLSKCPLGYMHRVPVKDMARFEWSFMVMRGEVLRKFSLERLPGKRRNKVRQALKKCRVEKLNFIEEFINEIREINISESLRQMKYGHPEVPVERYTEQEYQWREQLVKEFYLGGREWWGAFVDRKLIGYIRYYEVDGIVVIEQTRANTDYLKYRPVDALYFTILSNLSIRDKYKLVINGTPLRESLDRFKKQYLFEELPLYWYITRFAAWMRNFARMFRR